MERQTAGQVAETRPEIHLPPAPRGLARGQNAQSQSQLPIDRPDRRRPQRIACRHQAGMPRAAFGAVLDVLFQDAPLGFHDAIVEECREHPLNLQAIHIAPEFSQSAGWGVKSKPRAGSNWSSSALRSASRPRRMRDFTVPSEMSRTSAISS